MLLDVESISVEIDKTYNNINEFIDICKSERLEDSSYQDWSYKDVVAHLARWISFSADRLKSIIDKVPYHYLKRRNYWYFLKVLETTEGIYSLFSNGNSKVYSFEEYEDTTGMVKERIEELRNTYKGIEILNKVIDANH